MKTEDGVQRKANTKQETIRGSVPVHRQLVWSVFRVSGFLETESGWGAGVPGRTPASRPPRVPHTCWADRAGGHLIHWIGTTWFLLFLAQKMQMRMFHADEKIYMPWSTATLLYWVKMSRRVKLLNLTSVSLCPTDTENHTDQDDYPVRACLLNPSPKRQR